MGNTLSQGNFDPTRFDGVTYKNTRYFSLNGHKCYGKVVRVTDGDPLNGHLSVIWVVIDFPEIETGELHPTIFKCTLCKVPHSGMAGYDVPELNDSDPDKREVAKRYKSLLQEQIENKNVWLEFGEPTSFERQSVNVFLLDEEGEPLNESVNSILGRE